MDDASRWHRLTELLTEDGLVGEAVETAIEDGDDAWGALIDALDDAGAVAYLDADDTGMELADALAQLPRVFRLQPDLDDVNDTDDLADAMRLADETLAAGGDRLVRLAEPDSDAHVLVAVPAGSLPEILRLAAEVGGSASALR